MTTRSSAWTWRPPARSCCCSRRAGYGKRTVVDNFRTTGRGVQGVIALKITDKTGPIAAAVITGPDVEEVMVGSAKAIVYRTAIKDIRTLGRVTQGVQVMTKLSPDDQVISMSAFKERDLDQVIQPPAIATIAAPPPSASSNGHASPSQLTLGLEDEVEDDDGRRTTTCSDEDGLSTSSGTNSYATFGRPGDAVGHRGFARLETCLCIRRGVTDRPLVRTTGQLEEAGNGSS